MTKGSESERSDGVRTRHRTPLESAPSKAISHLHRRIAWNADGAAVIATLPPRAPCTRVCATERKARASSWMERYSGCARTPVNSLARWWSGGSRRSRSEVAPASIVRLHPQVRRPCSRALQRFD
jgi:hypothetical protein